MLDNNELPDKAYKNSDNGVNMSQNDVSFNWQDIIPTLLQTLQRHLLKLSWVLEEPEQTWSRAWVVLCYCANWVLKISRNPFWAVKYIPSVLSVLVADSCCQLRNVSLNGHENY